MLDKNGYAGLPWGASEADFRAKQFEIYRTMDLASLRPGYSMSSVTLTEGPIPCIADFSFKDGGLLSVYLRFRPSDFTLMARRLAYRYGRPSLEEQDRLLWKGERTTILMLRSSTTPDIASAFLMPQDEEAAVLAYGASSESADG